MPTFSTREELRNRSSEYDWIEIDDYEVFTLGNSDRVAEGEEPDPTQWPDPISDPESSLHTTHDVAMGRLLKPTTPKERIVVLTGEAVFQSATSFVTLKRMQWMDVPAEGGILRNAMAPNADGHRPQVEVGRIAGHWREALRTAVFHFGPGRPCDYHYHDSDEYWFLFRGNCTLNIDGEDHEIGPGSIAALGMGEEHGVLDPSEVFEGIGFAPQLEGQKRDGHLWKPIHGEPVRARQLAQQR